MAKTTKDITTFEGGIVNAVETSDAGEDKGTFRMVNMDGITKKGILRTSGSMVAVDPAIGSVDIQYMEPGAGFEIMPLDFDLGGDIKLEDLGSYDYNTNTTTGGSGTFTYDGGGGGITWTTTGDSQTATLEFDTVTLTSGKWYSYEAVINPSDHSEVRDAIWVTLDTATYDTTINNGFDNTWSTWGLRSAGTDVEVSQKGIFKSDGSYFKLALYSGTGASGESIHLADLKITELSSGGSHELQFVQRLADT